MHAVTVENFRCFGERQTARLAPLTLLVGENSTGKTSFLALLRALDDLAHETIPNFKQPPYDLGSFEEIAHYGGDQNSRADTFNVEVTAPSAVAGGQAEWKLTVEFGKEGTAPVPVYHRVSRGKTSDADDKEDAWIAVDFRSFSFTMGAKGKKFHQPEKTPERIKVLLNHRPDKMPGMTWFFFNALPDQPSDEYQDLLLLLGEIRAVDRAFASAPVRSQPRRVYDPARPASDPEGDYVPMLLAELSSQQPDVWANLKQRLEKFGQSSGLFDDIRIRDFGESDSDPFQVQVRKSRQTGTGGPWRNLMDVGYGVSQALPIITELLRGEAEQQSSENSRPRQFLLQQPEVHLHPSAQAALGSLFCQMAGPRRQLIVETHSDNLMDRVRMDVRDGVSGLKPEDVSILFFERHDTDVRIHSLRIDQEGNVLNAPDGYRQFFMDEMTRSVWPERSAVEV